MIPILKLYNKTENYDWGSKTLIPQFLGEEPDNTPKAELWMGAHGKLSSEIIHNGKKLSLIDIIDDFPREILGEEVAARYENKLPYLMKIIAAEKPLSIQSHPDKKQAKEGFFREEKLGIDINAKERNYKDINHKPEYICAVTEFWTLRGFRKSSEIITIFNELFSNNISETIIPLLDKLQNKDIRSFFKEIMELHTDKKNIIIKQVISRINAISHKSNIHDWILKLNREYPGDIGVLSPIMLNLIKLNPGEAMFLPSGELHAYLSGMGIELMANSDNVLRGGLTTKHVDLPELMKTLSFSEEKPEIFTPQKENSFEQRFPVFSDEFSLSKIILDNKKQYAIIDNSSVKIYISVEGSVSFTDTVTNKTIKLKRGESVLIPGKIKKYSISGQGELFCASVPNI